MRPSELEGVVNEIARVHSRDGVAVISSTHNSDVPVDYARIGKKLDEEFVRYGYRTTLRLLPNSAEIFRVVKRVYPNFVRVASESGQAENENGFILIARKKKLR